MRRIPSPLSGLSRARRSPIHLLPPLAAGLVAALALGLGSCTTPEGAGSAPDAAGPAVGTQAGMSAEARIEALLARMTLEEKVGQMTQVTIDVVSKSGGGPNAPHALDPAKLQDAIVRHHVGSILNVSGTAYTLDHWYEVIPGIQDVATKATRLGIPVLYGIDAIHGANYTLGATVFPQAFALAATWDVELAERIGAVAALEIRASGIPWNFYPVLDIGRQPLWSRFWETFGEDVELASALGAAYIRGLQGDDPGAPEKAAACLKHYAGYSFPSSGKDRTPAWIDERMMRQYFLPTFEAGVRAGALSVMVNSGELNGIPGHANHHLLTEVLKGEWGFRGFVVSDWEDIKRLHTRDRVAETPKEAVRMAVMAGVDMSMVPYDFSFHGLLVELVKEGRVPMERIDDATRRILRVKEAVGLFRDPYPRKDLASRFAAPESTAVNLRAAREAVTLLKNEGGLLPLAKGTKVLVAGPTADLLSCLNGGWTITWQGDVEALYPKDKPTIRRAIEEIDGPANVAHEPGSTFDAPLDVAAAVAAAREADAVILCLGEKAYCETPGNIDDLTLPEAQLELAEALSATGKPIVLVLAEGRPRVITRIAGRIPAILMAYLPGMEGGRAVAEVIFGDVSPSGKLPFSYPRAPNALTPYDHKPLEAAEGNRYDPLFPFGHGLSYTTFTYEDLKLDAERTMLGDEVGLSVAVRNAGARAGTEVVQVYVTDVYGSVSRPVRELKRWARVELEPGERKVIRFTIATADLSFVGLENRRVVEPGLFRVSVGGLTQEFVMEE